MEHVRDSFANTRKEYHLIMTHKSVLLFALIFAVVVTPGFGWAKPEKAAPQDKNRLQPREIKIDSNYDGKVDRTEIYDAEGNVIRVEVDSNADGKIDEWLDFDGGVRTSGKRDLDGDGKADVFLIYDKEGNLTRLESDTSGDGKIDEWVFYEDGAPRKAEKDTNGDGKADTWIEY